MSKNGPRLMLMGIYSAYYVAGEAWFTMYAPSLQDLLIVPWGLFLLWAYRRGVRNAVIADMAEGRQ